MNGTLLAALGGFALLLSIGCGLLLVQTRRDDRVTARLKAATRPDAQAGQPLIDEKSSFTFMGVVGMLGQAIANSGLLPAKTLVEFQHTLNAAGFRGRGGLSRFIGGKVLMLLLVPFLVYMLMTWRDFSPMTRNLAVFGGMVIGLLSPDWIVRSIRKRHLASVERGLPDALDMMVICAEAGLALEPAITRVGREIGNAHPAVSMEFLQTASELRIVADHKLALVQMGARTGLDSIKRLTTTLVQTIHYGTPLTDALRVLSAELRQELLTRFEARAARLPVLLTLPMIVFILPCVFLVVGGPAIIQILHVIRNTG